MDLARRQAALARLAVDAELRRAFLDAPEQASERLGISTQGAEQLAEELQGLPQFALALLRKRLGEVRRLLPETSARMGQRFDEEFLSYAAAHPSEGLHRHDRDALALAARLQTGLEAEALATLQCETGWIEARLGRRLLVRRLATGGFAVWLRTPGALRHWRFGKSLAR